MLLAALLHLLSTRDELRLFEPHAMNTKNPIPDQPERLALDRSSVAKKSYLIPFKWRTFLPVRRETNNWKSSW